MKDIGIRVGMDYGCKGSSSNLTNARYALVNSYGYSSDAAIIPYNSSTIETKFFPQFNVALCGGPVIMAADTNATSGVGHVWVCDGYKRIVDTLIHNPGTVYEYKTYTITNFYLSMNWGWSG